MPDPEKFAQTRASAISPSFECSLQDVVRPVFRIDRAYQIGRNRWLRQGRLAGCGREAAVHAPAIRCVDFSATRAQAICPRKRRSPSLKARLAAAARPYAPPG